jgi:hypothetical protein
MSAWVSHSAFIGAIWIAAIFGGIGIGAAFISAIVGYQLTEESLAEANRRIADTFLWDQDGFMGPGRRLSHHSAQTAPRSSFCRSNSPIA